MTREGRGFVGVTPALKDAIGFRNRRESELAMADF